MKDKMVAFFSSKYLLSILITFFGYIGQVQAFDLTFEALGPTEIKEGESVVIKVSFIPDVHDLCAAELTLANPVGEHDVINTTTSPTFAVNTATSADISVKPDRTAFTLSYQQYKDSSDYAESKEIRYTATSDLLFSEATEFFRDHYFLKVIESSACNTLPDIQMRHFPQITIINQDTRELLTPEFNIQQDNVEEGAGELTVGSVNITPVWPLEELSCIVNVKVSVDESSTAVEGEDFELVLPRSATTRFDSVNKGAFPVKINLLENLKSTEDTVIRLKADFSLVLFESEGHCRLPDSGLPIIKEVKINAKGSKSDLTASFEEVNTILKEGSGASEVAKITFSLPSMKTPDEKCSATASVKVSGGTAELGKDFNFTEKLITFKSGDASSKTVPISLNVLSGVADGNKTVKLQAVFSNTLGGDSSCPLVSAATKEINIEITDDPYEKPKVTLTSSSSTPAEGEIFTMLMVKKEGQDDLSPNPRSPRGIGTCKMSVDWIPSTKPVECGAVNGRLDNCFSNKKLGRGFAREGSDYIIVNKITEVDFSKSNPVEIKVRVLNDVLLEGDEVLELAAVLKGKADANNPHCASIPETIARLTNVVIKDKSDAKKVIIDPEDLNDRICDALVEPLGGAAKANNLTGNDKKYYDSNCKNQTEETIRNFEPEEIATQTNAVLGAASRQLRNVRSRLDKLRSSNGQRGIDVAGANLNIQGTSLSVGLLGGGASGDGNELLKNSRWGLFTNGEYAFGDNDRGNDLKVGSGDRNFDFNSTGLTIGADYRFPGEKMIAGAAIGYKDFKSDFSDQKGFTNTKGSNISFYGTYLLSDKSYLDAIVGFGKDSIDSRRPVNNDGSTNDATFAIGKPDAKEYTFSVGGGYEIHREDWTYTPYGRLDYTKATIDAYKEIASHVSADTSMLSINKQTIESLTSSLGIKATRVYSTSKGVFIPHASLEWKHDFKERGTISGNSVFLQDFNTTLFPNVDDTAFEESDRSKLDKDYYNLSLGVSAVLPKGRSAYLNFESRLGDSTIKDNAVKAGFRWEF